MTTSTTSQTVVYSTKKETEMDSAEIAAFATIALGVVSTYAQNRADMARIKERVYQLEKTETSNEQKLQRIEQAITRVEMALVKAGLINHG